MTATATAGRPDTRSRIIEAGTAVVNEKGYHGCGLKEILDAAGVPKGSFYHYFKSKEDFGVAVIEDFTARYTQKLSRVLGDRSKPAMQRLRDHFAAAEAWYDEHGYEQTCLVAKLGMDVATMSPDMRSALKQGMDQWRAVFARCLRDAQSQGDIDEAWDADELAGLLLDAWEGVAMHTQLARNTSIIHNFVRVVLDQMLTKTK